MAGDSRVVRAALVQAKWTGDTESMIKVHDLDLGMIDEVRRQWAFYRDRRPDAYDPLVEP